jgi:hypothetical protein
MPLEEKRERMRVRRAWGARFAALLAEAAATIQGIMRDRPDLADWWIKAEAESLASKPSGEVFRKDRLSYASMLDAVRRQNDFDFGDADRAIECLCTEDMA